MGVFDVIGPIMIGPSSSHTAGAQRIGLMAHLIFNDLIKNIEVYFHGSFAHTYKGHGTDRAIIAGILGIDLGDEKIKQSLDLVKKKKISFSFRTIDLKDAHPNSVKIILSNDNKRLTMIASSIGGGNIILSRINEYEVNIKGKFFTLWIIHKDKPGQIAFITSILEKSEINIAYMSVFRKNRGKLASSIIELDQNVDEKIINLLKKQEGIKDIRFIPSLF